VLFTRLLEFPLERGGVPNIFFCSVWIWLLAIFLVFDIELELLLQDIIPVDNQIIERPRAVRRALRQALFVDALPGTLVAEVGFLDVQKGGVRMVYRCLLRGQAVERLASEELASTTPRLLSANRAVVDVEVELRSSDQLGLALLTMLADDGYLVLLVSGVLEGPPLPQALVRVLVL